MQILLEKEKITPGRNQRKLIEYREHILKCRKVNQFEKKRITECIAEYIWAQK